MPENVHGAVTYGYVSMCFKTAVRYAGLGRRVVYFVRRISRYTKNQLASEA